MPLASGTRLGPYEIVAPLGEGGMGEVYRARDTKLDRDVALKILPPAFAADAERVARFRREAKTLAALNHPHIAQIYGLEEAAPSAGTGSAATALVMELVEGDDLAARIRRGPVPLDEALAIARQIADALAAAHEQGIVHRDLKPANVKVRPDGTVKVLDFGLAKAVEPAGGAAGDATASPTITSPAMTAAGMILGTAAYMAPEQAKGRPVDRRADLWAFGCVLYELLTGERAFKGEDVTDTIAAVVSKEPDWSALPASTPPAIRTLLRRCLTKDRTRRLDSAAAARLDLDEAHPGAMTDAGEDAPGRSRLARAFPRSAMWVIALLATIGFAYSLAWRGATSQPVAGPALRAAIELGVDARLMPLPRGGMPLGYDSSVAVAPDGKAIVYAAEPPNGPRQLYLRPLDQLEAVAIGGTHEAAGPVFSPDGRWIAFFAEQKLKKVGIGGGAVSVLCDVPDGGRGLSWGDDDWIVFTPTAGAGGRLMRVPATGGTPEPLTTLAQDEATHRWPHVLPGAKAVVYTAATSNTSSGDRGYLVAQRLDGGAPVVIRRDAAHGQYVSSGHLLYAHDGKLFAVPFDPEGLAVTGPAVPVVEGVSYQANTGASQFSVSNTGVLAYVSTVRDVPTSRLAWLDRGGEIEPLGTLEDRADNANLTLSPRGDRLLIELGAYNPPDLWLFEVARGALGRVTFDAAEDARPVWAPDGRSVAFMSDRNAEHRQNLYWMRVDEAGEPTRIVDSASRQTPTSWHPSGRHLAFTQDSANGIDVMILDLESDQSSGVHVQRSWAFASTAARESDGQFSPDGRWLAYQSMETGRGEVYVQPFPGPGRKWQISVDGIGPSPIRWSRTSNELFFNGLENELMVARYAVNGDEFRAERPTRWDRPGLVRDPKFDVHPDGKRMLIVIPGDGTPAPNEKLVVMTNVFDLLRRLAPPAR